MSLPLKDECGRQGQDGFAEALEILRRPAARERLLADHRELLDRLVDALRLDGEDAVRGVVHIGLPHLQRIGVDDGHAQLLKVEGIVCAFMPVSAASSSNRTRYLPVVVPAGYPSDPPLDENSMVVPSQSQDLLL